MRGWAAAGALTLAALVGVSGCAGKTIVLEPEGGAPSSPAETSGSETPPASPEPAPPEPAPGPGQTPSSSAEPGDGRLAADPSGAPSPVGSPSPGHPPREEPPRPAPSKTETRPGAQPSPGPSPDSGDGPEAEKFTFPGWEEHIYTARNVNSPPGFRERERFRSCDDHASVEGIDLISPALAACLDAGRELTPGSTKPGKEAAIAVQTGTDRADVWFVRVGPEISEYFIARGSDWVHARCDGVASIGVLDCEAPSTVASPPGDGAGSEDERPHDEEPNDPPTEAPNDPPTEAPSDPPGQESGERPGEAPSESAPNSPAAEPTPSSDPGAVIP